MEPKIYSTLAEFNADYSYDLARPDLVLGRGTYGKVVKARYKPRNLLVAIKISEFDGNDDRSLRAEVERARKLPAHSNVAVYEACHRIVDSLRGTYDYAIMQLYKDGNLASLMGDPSRPLTDYQRWELVRGILLGLQHLHKNRIVHRDFKPHNILIDYDEFADVYVPLIADFGLSRLVKDEELIGSDFNLSDGRGTLPYKAPEQFENQKASFNLDLWAFGVMLYELMTGRKPFYVANYSDNSESARQQIQKQIIAAQLPADVSQIAEPYQTMIRQCLVKDIKARVRTEAPLIALLDANKPKPKKLRGNIDDPGPTDPWVHPPITPKPKPVERKPVEPKPVEGKATVSRPKIYPLAVIFAVGFPFLGGPLGLGYVMAHNFKVLKKPLDAQKTWLWAILATCFEFVLFFSAPDVTYSDIPLADLILYVLFDWIIPIAGSVFVAGYLAKRYQKTDIQAYIRAGGSSFSGYRALGVGLAGYVLTIILLILSIFVHDAFFERSGFLGLDFFNKVEQTYPVKIITPPLRVIVKILSNKSATETMTDSTAIMETDTVAMSTDTTPVADSATVRSGSLTLHDFPKLNTSKFAAPSLVDVPFDEASFIIKGATLTMGDTTYVVDGTKENGTVARQRPQAGEQVRVGQAVDLWVAFNFTAPGLVGYPLDEASVAIRGSSLTVGAITYIDDASKEAGTVVRQYPRAGQPVTLRQAINLWVVSAK